MLVRAGLIALGFLSSLSLLKLGSAVLGYHAFTSLVILLATAFGPIGIAAFLWKAIAEKPDHRPSFYTIFAIFFLVASVAVPVTVVSIYVLAPTEFARTILSVVSLSLIACLASCNQVMCGTLKGLDQVNAAVFFESASGPISALLFSVITYVGVELEVISLLFFRIAILQIFLVFSLLWLGRNRKPTIVRDIGLNSWSCVRLCISKALNYVSNNIDAVILVNFFSLSDFGNYKLARQVSELCSVGLVIVSPKYGSIIRQKFKSNRYLDLRLLQRQARLEVASINGFLLLISFCLVFANFQISFFNLSEWFYISFFILSIVPLTNMQFGIVNIFNTMLDNERAIIVSSVARILAVSFSALTGSVLLTLFVFTLSFWSSKLFLHYHVKRYVSCP